MIFFDQIRIISHSFIIFKNNEALKNSVNSTLNVGLVTHDPENKSHMLWTEPARCPTSGHLTHFWSMRHEEKCAGLLEEASLPL